MYGLARSLRRALRPGPEAKLTIDASRDAREQEKSYKSVDYEVSDAHTRETPFA